MAGKHQASVTNEDDGANTEEAGNIVLNPERKATAVVGMLYPSGVRGSLRN